MTKLTRDSLSTTKTSTSVTYFAVYHEENQLCELCITHTHNNSSWYGVSLESEMTAKALVFRDSLFTPRS